MAQDGREGAAAFCAEQFPRLCGGLALYVGDRAVAEELAQEALLRACTHWQRVSRLQSPQGWVWRVALNLATSTLRRRAAERRANRRLEGPDVVRARDDTDVTHDRLAVRQVIASLPTRQRTALVLRFYADLSVEDTAQRMGATPDSVRSLTKRAVAAIRGALATPRT